MSQELNAAIAVIGIDIGKNSFHIERLKAPLHLVTDRYDAGEPVRLDRPARAGTCRVVRA